MSRISNAVRLTLSPAYDICPQSRTGNEPTQAMLILEGERSSQLALCVRAASHFLLSQSDARDIIDRQLQGIHSHWRDVCDEAALPEPDRNLLWQRQFLNPFALEGYDG